MGSALSKVINDTVNEDKATARDALNSLMEISQKNYELFRKDIIARENNMEVPVERVVMDTHTIRAKVSKEIKGTSDAVNEVIGSFATGDFLKAITSTVDLGLKALLGNMSASVAERKDYLVSVGPLGGVYRIDYYFYANRFTSDKLFSICEDVVCCAVVVSAVDVNSLSRNVLNVIVQSKFGGTELTPEQLKAMRDDIWKEVLSQRTPAVSGALPAPK